jgi:predicted metal-dependent enzyme (double-stranded beta helix superfamily)
MKYWIAALALMFARAAQQQESLPLNYQTIYENDDLLVMHVHYGPREFIPMHDHTAFPTLFVYLNDSGPVKITHDTGDDPSVIRPPTHAGAFRLAPGMSERHSVTSQSNTASDFLRVELKKIPADDIKDVFRGEVPATVTPGTHAEFSDKALRIERIFCSEGPPCPLDRIADRSLLIALKAESLQTPNGPVLLNPGNLRWIAGGDKRDWELNSGSQFLRVVLLYP